MIKRRSPSSFDQFAIYNWERDRDPKKHFSAERTEFWWQSLKTDASLSSTTGFWLLTIISFKTCVITFFLKKISKKKLSPIYLKIESVCAVATSFWLKLILKLRAETVKKFHAIRMQSSDMVEQILQQSESMWAIFTSKLPQSVLLCLRNPNASLAPEKRISFLRRLVLLLIIVFF